jgi:hypothetical protein
MDAKNPSPHKCNALVWLDGQIIGKEHQPDSFPVHYPLLDSIGTNFNLERNLLVLTQTELQNPSLPWWDRSVLYSNYFHSV